MEILLHTQDLTKVFMSNNEKIYALNKVNISIEKGKFVILNGKSGSGKTTLINQLGALDHETSGKVFLEDTDITQLNDNERDALRRTKYGFIFQSVALMSFMTAYENVDLTLRIAGLNAQQRHERVMECLKIVGLDNKSKHYPAQLSGGEQQRVAIARAIATHPKIIFADEPTAELDSHTALTIVKMFKDLVSYQDTTIVMTTHDPEMISVADKVYVLQDGEIIDE